MKELVKNLDQNVAQAGSRHTTVVSQMAVCKTRGLRVDYHRINRSSWELGWELNIYLGYH